MKYIRTDNTEFCNTINYFFSSIGEINYLKGVFEMAKERNSLSRLFIFTKHTVVEENILYVAKEIHSLMNNKPKHIDELLEEYSKNNKLNLNLNMERVIYLALTFLYAVGKVNMENNMIIKVEEGR